MVFWYTLWSFGIFFPFWYVCTKKNLATLFVTSGLNAMNGISTNLRGNAKAADEFQEVFLEHQVPILQKVTNIPLFTYL
jgi:hypothetical protein